MKRSKVLIVLALLAVSASFLQCGSDPPAPVDPQDEQLQKLSFTWTCTGATLDGNAMDDYIGMDITMSGTVGNATFNYTTTGRPSPTSPWDANGTFTFGSDFATVITRNDNVPMTYSVSTAQLQLSFSYTGAGFASRTSSVQGNWVFNFNK